LANRMRRICRVAFLIVCCCVVSQAQTRNAPEFERVSKDKGPVQTYRFQSKLMGRPMLFQVVAPLQARHSANYRGPKLVYPIMYLLHGLAGHYDNWSTKTQIAKYAAEYKWTIVLPEGGDGWYTDSVTVSGDRYESYLINELFPLIDRWFGPDTSRTRGIAGLSMGGYGAIKFGLKYPEKFSIVGSFSGALDAPLRTEKSAFLRPSITSVFGPDDSRTRIDNDVFGLARNAATDKTKTLPFIYLDCGTEDPFLPVNRDFDALLVDKKIPHEFRELPGNHGWEYWDRQIQEFLRVANTRRNSYPR